MLLRELACCVRHAKLLTGGFMCENVPRNDGERGWYSAL